MKAESLLDLLHDQLVAAGVPPFDDAVARVAVIAFGAYQRARRPKGMLSGRPGYEAAEVFRNRLRSAASTSADLPDFVRQLYARLHLDQAAIGTEDILWVRASTHLHRSAWLRLSSDAGINEIAQGVGLLSTFTYEAAVAAASPTIEDHHAAS